MHGLGMQLALWAEHLQRGAMYACIAALAIIVPAYLISLCRACGAGGGIAGRVKSLWRGSKIGTVVLLVCVGVAIETGATKSNSYRSDPEIGLVSWETETTYGEPYQAGTDPETGDPIMASNIVSFVWMFATTNNVCPEPISYRATNTNYWEDVVKTTPGWSAQKPVLDHSDGTTNWWTLAQADYVSYTNALRQATTQWYVGKDLPSVEVTMGELVTIDRIEAHSTGFKVEWTVDGAVDFANKRLTRDSEDVSVRQLKTYSFDDATLTVRITSAVSHTVVVVPIEDYDGSVTELTVGGFFVNQLSSVYVGLTLTNLQEVE